MSAHRKTIGVLEIALPATLAGCTSAGSPSGAPSQGVPSEVRVTVVDVEGSEGGSLAGVLSKGSEPFPAPTAALQVGGFGVAVDADPFTTTQTVNEPEEPVDQVVGLFPSVTDTPLLVEPGTYTLMLWAASNVLSPYSRWIPADTAGLRGCWVTFEAEAGTGATLTITDIPDWLGTDTAIPAAKCETG